MRRGKWEGIHVSLLNIRPSKNPCISVLVQERAAERTHKKFCLNCELRGTISRSKNYIRRARRRRYRRTGLTEISSKIEAKNKRREVGGKMKKGTWCVVRSISSRHGGCTFPLHVYSVHRSTMLSNFSSPPHLNEPREGRKRLPIDIKSDSEGRQVARLVHLSGMLLNALRT